MKRISHSITSQTVTPSGLLPASRIILNNSLGYQITHYLDKFEYDKVHKTTTFSGNINFNLDMAVNGHNRKEFEAGRKKHTTVPANIFLARSG